MEKNAIKKYAIWARRELISRISGRAAWYGVTEDCCVDTDADSIDGRVLSATEKKQRAALVSKVQHEGYEQAIEEIAYTWFNRFCALRYMEVNGYLPSHIRVFTDDANEFKPQILDEAIHLEIEGLDKEKVLTYKDTNDSEGLYRYLLITQCNALSYILPGMFQKIEDYTELLLPENLLREGSVIERMIAEIPEEDWTDQVQIIGWLYQYYNAEKKDEVFAALKKNVKITKENIPAATQLFTPDWIVRYMVENTLGRLWMEGHPNDELKSNWKYYLDEAEQEPEVEKQLAEIRKEYTALKPENIKCIDPCCGSGHILVYMFDVLMQIYKAYGYTTHEAVNSIINNNLYGLDIDERAAQLAYFAVIMKARSYDSNFFDQDIQPRVYAIQESNSLNSSLIDYFVGENLELKKEFMTLIDELYDAKEYGSILKVSSLNFHAMYMRINKISNEINFYASSVENAILPLIQVGELLAQQYNVVVTNPPYMGVSNMSKKLADFIKRKFPASKADLYAAFIERCGQMTIELGYQAMITQHTWMFLGSYEGLRKKIYNRNIHSLVHLGIKAFEDIGNDIVQTCSFVLWNLKTQIYNSIFIRLVDCKNYRLKEKEYLAKKYRSLCNCNRLNKIPGSPLAYWVSDNFIGNFEIGDRIEQYGLFTGSQNITGNNDKYLRQFWELNQETISDRWIFYAKGGDYRQYYGNLDIVIDWSKKARNFYLNNKTSNLLNEKYWYKEGITYSAITSRGTGFRYLPPGCVFDKGGPTINIIENLYVILALLNSNVGKYYFWVFNPTINLQVKDIKNFPILFPEDMLEIERIAKENTEICRQDWDAYETAWNFQCHPLISHENSTIASAFVAWEAECTNRFNVLKENEEKINSIFIETYGLQEELNPEVEYRDITVRKAELQREIKSLISYAVGCMFGRYSLDADGLAYAGGEWDNSKYQTYQPDFNGILPICDDEYFADDIVGHFIDFIRTAYGRETLEENLQFIAEALGGNGSSREIIRKYFLEDFFADHCKIYQKRPIYWLFDSGKKNGFKCLIYLHRYRPDTIARIRTDYVHEQQARYRTTIADLENRIETASTSDHIKLNKELKKVQEQADELHDYEEKIHHLADQYIDIDLDDGVKVNYAKFQDVLAKIK